ncbi:MAG: response regulator [Lachnospiraceae bacterium]
MKVLLVDDEIIALNMLKKRVDWVKYGFSEILTAQDVNTAKAVLEKHTVDLIITDIEMPGEDGLSLIRYVRSAYPSVECIFITCHASFDYIKEAMKYQARDYVLKPIDFDELHELLQKFLVAKLNEKSKIEIEQILFKKQHERRVPAEECRDRIAIVRQYIEEHLQEQIQIDQLAEVVHVNSQYLMRLFKQEMGQSIMDYINERKIQTAGKLLKETDYSINFIADCVGCESNSYFTRLFKKYTGLSPSEYRSRFKE